MSLVPNRSRHSRSRSQYYLQRRAVRLRETERTYAIRRVVALGLALVLVVGAITVIRAALGAFGGNASVDAQTLHGSVTAWTGGAPPSSSDLGFSSDTVVAGSTIPESFSGPTIAPAATAANTEPSGPTSPAVIYIAGDSAAGTFGPYLEQLLSGSGLATITLDYKVSSGLARPDFYDWPARFREQLATISPDIVVVTFGGNDAQPISGFPVDSDAWREKYGQRVGEVMDLLSADARTVIWVGIPNASDPDMTARMMVQDQVVRAEAAERPGLVFVDTWDRFSGRNGGYAEFVIDPRDGQGKDVRADDGFHLNQHGAEILALDIANAVNRALTAR